MSVVLASCAERPNICCTGMPQPPKRGGRQAETCDERVWSFPAGVDGGKILAPLVVSREGRTRVGVIPRTRPGVWSQESVMMTVVTSPSGLDPVQELTQ